MAQDELTWPVFALSLDDRQETHGPEGLRSRLVTANANGKPTVAIFLGEQFIDLWCRAMHPRNSVIRRFPINDRDEFLGFLRDLVASGDTHVCINPGPLGTAAVPIAVLARQLGQLG